MRGASRGGRVTDALGRFSHASLAKTLEILNPPLFTFHFHTFHFFYSPSFFQIPSIFALTSSLISISSGQKRV